VAWAILRRRPQYLAPRSVLRRIFQQALRGLQTIRCSAYHGTEIWVVRQPNSSEDKDPFAGTLLVVLPVGLFCLFESPVIRKE
jgi:hypothetical protein